MEVFLRSSLREPVQEERVSVEEAIQWCSKEACEAHFPVGQEAKKDIQDLFPSAEKNEVSCTGAVIELCKG